MQKLLILISSMGFCLVLFAQEKADSIYVLPESTVKGDRVYDMIDIITLPPTPREVYQKENPSSDLSKLLSSTSGFVFQNYGVSGSSLAHYRGSSPEQFQVNWNGVNINSPFLGMFDFSLVPGSFFSDSSINQSEVGVLQGAGGVGGSLNLNDNYADAVLSYDGRELNTDAQIEFSSLNNLFVISSFSVRTNRRSSLTKIAFSDFENNFEFANTAQAGNPATPMQNADGLILNVAQNFSQRISKDIVLRMNYWGTIGERGIPIQDFQTERDDRQEDASHRISLIIGSEPTTYWLQNQWQFGMVQVFDRISFNGDESLARKSSAFVQFEKTTNYGSNSLSIETRLNGEFMEAETRNYSELQERNVFGLAANTEYLLKDQEKLKLGLALRQDLLDGAFMPVVATLSIGQAKYLSDGLNWQVKATRNYRHPSLNDWYWSPGGNPNLLPENSRGLESSQAFLVSAPLQGQLSIKLAEYYNFTTNWIQWRPNPEGFWSPENVNEVQRLGLDWTLAYSTSSDSKGFFVNLSGNINRARRKNGDRLLYNPTVKNNLAVYFHPFENWKVGSNYEWQTRRWDGADFMDDLHVVDFSINRGTSLRSGMMNLQVSVKNLFDKAYVYRPHQIMPGRHFSIKISYNHSKNSNEKIYK